MEELHVWLVRQFDERRVEPNSSLGGAISYMLKHWERLTLFLHVAGAPLDNNVCERALKRAILHRKNALFYKTCHGAHVGDLFMSLIHTCELCGANAFDYLTELDRHADALPANRKTGCRGTIGGRWPRPLPPLPTNHRPSAPLSPLAIKDFHGCRKHTTCWAGRLRRPFLPRHPKSH